MGSDQTLSHGSSSQLGKFTLPKQGILFIRTCHHGCELEPRGLCRLCGCSAGRVEDRVCKRVNRCKENACGGNRTMEVG